MKRRDTKRNISLSLQRIRLVVKRKRRSLLTRRKRRGLVHLILHLPQQSQMILPKLLSKRIRNLSRKRRRLRKSIC